MKAVLVIGLDCSGICPRRRTRNLELYVDLAGTRGVLPWYRVSYLEIHYVDMGDVYVHAQSTIFVARFIQGSVVRSECGKYIAYSSIGVTAALGRLSSRARSI